MLWAMMTLLRAFAIAAFALSGSSAQAKTDPVEVTGGQIRGKGSDDGVAWFAGIPYAASPVGPLRWHAPEPPPPWSGVLDTTKPASECLQDRSGMRAFVDRMARGLGHRGLKRQLVRFATRPGAVDEDEDCLYLNVRTGNLGGADPQPVMVWIHGGGFTNGSGTDLPYRSEALVEGGVVLVTLNYRLGPFGFFAHPALSAEALSPDRATTACWIRSRP